MPSPSSDTAVAGGEPPGIIGVTDAHLHLWDLTRSPYTWLGSIPALHRTITWADARAGHEDLGITRVILVQADDTRADTANLQAEAARIEADPGPVHEADVVAWLPLAEPEQVAILLADAAGMRRVVGVRHLVHDDPDPLFLERPRVAASLDLLAAARLPLDVPDAYPRHMEQVLRLARAHPELTIVLDHLGKPPLGDTADMGEWEQKLRDIAAQPRTVAKLSGLATSGKGEFAPAVQIALDAFGPERLMFGTDWPIAPRPMDHTCGAGALLAHLRRLLDASDQEQILSGTAERVYRRSE